MAGQVRKDIAAIERALGKVNALLEAAGVTNFKLGVADPRSLKQLPDKDHARFMRKEVYDVLKAGIERQGMSSLPFCFRDREGFHLLSGNHRSRAAADVGKELILFLYTDRAMTRQEQIAVQLAHNQVTGEDDPQILAGLWAELQDLDLKFMTGFDDNYFEGFQPVEFTPIKEPGVQIREVSIIFIQEDLDKIEEAAEAIEKAVSKEGAFLARYKDFDLFFEAVLAAKEAFKIVNTATAIRKMAEITLERLAEPAQEAHS